MRISRFAIGVWIGLAVIYGRILGYEFVSFDDDAYLYENLWMTFGLTPQAFIWAWSSNVVGHWHPITMLSHLLDVSFFGMKAGGHHFVSLLIHALNIFLVERLARILLKNRAYSIWIALAFAFHPLQIEVVAWASQRKTLLCTAFGLASTLSYIDWVHTRNPKKWMMTVLLFALGALSKPMIVSLPVIWLLMDSLIFKRPDFKQNILEKRPFWLMNCVAAYAVLHSHLRGGSIDSLSETTFLQNLANGVVSYSRYVIHWLFPFRLGVHYYHPQHWPVGVTVLAAVALLGGIGWAWKNRAQSPLLVTALGWYVIALIPVAGVVQVGTQGIADRYLYGPAMGLSVALLLLLKKALPEKYLHGVLAGILCFWAVQSVLQVPVWQNSHTLYENAIRVDPRNPIMHNNFGVLLNKEARFLEARALFEKAIEFKPNYAEAYSNLGVNYYKTGDKNRALELYLKAAELKSYYAAPHTNAAGVYVDWKQYDHALFQYREAVRKFPKHAAANAGVADILAAQGKCSEAMDFFKVALEGDPRQDNTRYNWAHCLWKLGDRSKAVEEYQVAVARKPELKKLGGTIARSLGIEVPSEVGFESEDELPIFGR